MHCMCYLVKWWAYLWQALLPLQSAADDVCWLLFLMSVLLFSVERFDREIFALWRLGFW